MVTSKYEQLSAERKALQAAGEIPDFYTTAGYQLFMGKYTLPGQTLKQRYQQIADASGEIAEELYPTVDDPWSDRFFDVMWKGWLSPSTPVLANMGADRGLPVSCSGGVVDDSIYGFFESRLEAAMLTKHGFGTSAYMGGIRPRGSEISVGGKASGVLPVIRGFVQDMSDVSQGSVRRGAWAGYLEIDHGDFYELCDYLYNNPDSLNVGWIVSDAFLERLDNGDQEAVNRYKKVMKTRSVTGRGYLFFKDKANRLAPKEFTHHGLTIEASNLCSEIFLPSDVDNTFTCVLSSMNAAKYDEWHYTDAVFVSTVFLDVVAETFIRKGRLIRGLEKAVRFTEKSRALGLGVLGFHTYAQQQGWTMGELKTHLFNTELFTHIRLEAEESSRFMATRQKEPEWCEGSGRRNLTLLAVAPNMSTAVICGGVSQGIEPIVANVYVQGSQGGEIIRLNPVLWDIMKERGVYNTKTMWSIINDNGSVKNVTWLSDGEKEVFRTAFEINQMDLLRLASQRQRQIDQGQSLNLFFAADEDPKYISKVHRAAAEDPYIKALYYMRSQAGVQASKGECTACEG